MVMVSCIRIFRMGAIALALSLPALASADLLQSSHFRLDPNVGSSFGGTGSSTSFGLQDSGGEAIVGNGSSSSYKLTQGYISHLQHSLQLSVMPSGIFSYFPLDTGVGNQVYDVSTSNNRGIAQGNGTWVAAKIGQGLLLNGLNQYVSTSVTETNPNPLSEELWFKTSTTQGGLLVGFSNAQTGAGTTNDRVLYMTDSGQLIFGVDASAHKTISTGATYNDGAFHHVVATLGTSGLTITVDGIRIATDGTTTAGSATTGYYRFGYASLSGWPSAPTSNYFSGILDEIHIFDRQINDAQAKGDYTAGLSGLRFAHVLPNLLAGTSSIYSADAVVQTDAAGYDLNLQAITLLTHTDATTTIPMISATIASPAAWSEGTTTGLGFTITSGTQVEAKWGIGPSSYNYAGVPLTATTFHSRVGVNGGFPEKTSVQYRVDANPGQKSGNYSAVLVYTATLKP